MYQQRTEEILKNRTFKKKEREKQPTVELKKTGDNFAGIYKSVKEVLRTSKFKGGAKELVKLYTFADPLTGEEFVFWGNGGFNGEFKYCGVQADDLIHVIMKEKITLDDGRPCNSYDILVADD